MKKRGKLGVLFGIFFAFFGVITAIRIAGASGNTFKLKSAEITEKSPQTEAEIINYNDTEVSTRVEFHALDEFVTYKLGLSNSDTKSYKIVKITAESENPYLAYEYNEDFEATVAEGESFDFILKTIYKTPVENINGRKQNADVIIKIAYEDESGNEEEEEVIVVPNTNDDTVVPNTGSTEKDGSKAVPIFPFIILLIGIIIAIILYAKKHKKAAGITLALTLALSIVAPLTAIAVIEDTITIKNQLNLYDKINIIYPTSEGTTNKVIDYGEPGGDIPAPTNTPSGYEFTGYEDQDGKDYDPTAPITGDLDLTPKYTPIHYTVSFNKNHETAQGTMANLEMTYDEAKTLPENQFSRPGYSFANWSTPSATYDNGASVFNLTTEKDGIVTLDANWIAGTYTVHYDGNGATSGSVADQTVTYDTASTFAANNFEKTGHTFIDWVCKDAHYAAGAELFNLATDKGQTITCKANWSTNNYQINYIDATAAEISAANMPTSYTFSENEFTHAGSLANRTGYNFLGWTGNGITEPQSSIQIAAGATGTQTFTANWAPIHFSFSFDANGGNGEMSNLVIAYDETNGTDIIPTSGFSKEGWSFNGWNTAANGTGTAFNPGDSVHNYTTTDGLETKLYAQWGSITYDIFYILNGGSASGNPVKYSPETPTFTLNNPTKTGYIFTGWSGTGLTGENNTTVTIAQGSYGAREYTAHFTPIHYYLHFVLGASPDTIADQEMFYDTPIQNNYNPSNMGYNFIGFALTENGDVAIAPGADIMNLTTENGAVVNLYAKYEGHAYTVNYADSLCYKSALTVYDEEEEGTEMYISNLIPGAPQQEVWGTAFNVKDVELRTPSGEYDYATTATYAPAEIIEGTATFKYWASTRNCNGDNNIYYAGSSALNVLNQPVDNEVTLYAMWDLTEFTIRIHKNAPANSNITGPEYFDLDTKYTVIDDIQLPAQDGYGYDAPGYILTGAVNVPDFDPARMGNTYVDMQAIMTTQNCDLTTNICNFYVIWKPIKYHIIYHNNGGNGSTTSQSNVTYGENINLSDGSTYTRDGYNLAGWSLTEGANNTKDYDLGQTVNNLTSKEGWTVNLYAVWEAAPQQITYNLNGGTADNPTAYTIEDTITLNNPTRPGYNFTGWSGTDLEGEDNMSVTIPEGSQGARSYTAHWSTISYGITYTGLDDLTEDELALMHNPTSYTVENGFTLDYPTHAGYTFTGWTGNNGSTPQIIVIVPVGTTGDLSFNANFVANTYTVVFDKNPGSHTIGGSMEPQTFTYDEEQALSDNLFNIDEAGFRYGGWNTAADGSGTHYDDKQVVSNLTSEANATITFYAEWGRTPYTIAFDKNNENATGEMLPVENITYGEHIVLPACGFVYNDHKIASWNTKPDGSGRSYRDQADVVNVAIDGTITLYAQWRDTEAIFDVGGKVNTKLKNLAGGASNITSVVHYTGTPDTSSFTEDNIISISSSPDTIYAWFDNGTIYYWSDDSTPALYRDSSRIFMDLSSATSIDLSNLDTSQAEDLSYLFYRCYSLSSLDLSGFNAENVTNLRFTFAETGLTALDLSSLSTPNLQNLSQTFYHSTQLSNIKFGPNFNTENVTSLYGTFANTSIKNIDLGAFKTSNVNNMATMFYGCSQLESIEFGNGFDTSSVINMSELFHGAQNLKSLDLSTWNTENVTNMTSMFDFNYALETVTFGPLWDTSKVQSMLRMFRYARSLTSLDLSMFNTASVTNMGEMFLNDSALTSIKFGPNFTTENVTSMGNMFANCSNLKELDLSSFDTKNVTSMFYMFGSSPKIKTIYVTDKFVVDQLVPQSDNRLFEGNYALVGGMGTAFTHDHRDKEYARIDQGSGTPGYFTDKNTLNIFFDANGGNGTMQSQTGLPANTDATLNPNQFSINEVGRVFGGWNTEPDGTGTHYDNEGTINAYGRVVLYAQWGATPYTVIFDQNAPTGITISGTMENISREYGERFNLPANQFSANGYAFLGWNTKADGKGKHYGDEEEVVNLDIDGEVTLYAEWKEMTALFDTGTNVRNTIESLVTPGHTIRKIKESATAPDLNIVAYKLLSLKDSYYPIYGWYDEDTETIYYWAEPEKLFLNPNSAAMFQSLLNVTEIDTTNFDTSRVTTMHGMFGRLQSLMYNEGDKKLTHLDLSNWDTSNVTDMRYMFYGCNSLESITLGDGWDTSNVTNMASMFQGNNALDGLNTTNWNTEKVTDMSNMFTGCSSLTSLDVADWKTGEVTTMSNMFAGCSSLSALNVNSWDTGNVTTMYNMFADCQSLTSLDLSRWNTENVTNMAQMFQGCSGLTTLDISRFNTEKVTNMSGMFGGTQYKKGCESLTSLNLSSFNTGAVTNMSNMFRGMTSLPSLNLSNFNTESVTDMSGLFQGMTSLSDLNISSFNTSSATTLAGMFANTKSLAVIDITHFNTRKVKSIANMFQGSIITELDLTNFDTTSLTGHAGFVYDAVNLKTIYVTENSDFTKASGYAPYYNTKLVGGANTPYEYYFSLKPEAGRIDDPDNGKRGLFTPKDSRYIRYDANGGEGEMTSHYVNVSATSTDKLHANEFTKEDNRFVGWNTEADGTGTAYTNEQIMSGVESSKTPLVLYAQWVDRYPNNSIIYDANGGDGEMDAQLANAGEDVILDSSNFSRTGYGFVGWNTNAEGTGTTYGPNETITKPDENKYRLYAKWVQSTGDLQNFDCSTLNIGDVTARTDTRDNETYAIAKLADGKCWMIENMRLDFSKVNGEISGANTNNPDSTFLSLVNTNKPEPSLSGVRDCSSNNADVLRECINKIDYGKSSTDNYERLSFGLYYNWYTATAGNGTYETEQGATVSGDICPAGWHLPSGTGVGDFGNLSNTLGGSTDDEGAAVAMNPYTATTGDEISAKFRKYPNNVIMSGFLSGQYARGRNRAWDSRLADLTTSTASAEIYNYAFRISNDKKSYGDLVQVAPGTNGTGIFKYAGYPIRCVTE